MKMSGVVIRIQVKVATATRNRYVTGGLIYFTIAQNRCRAATANPHVNVLPSVTVKESGCFVLPDARVNLKRVNVRTRLAHYNKYSNLFCSHSSTGYFH